MSRIHEALKKAEQERAAEPHRAPEGVAQPANTLAGGREGFERMSAELPAISDPRGVAAHAGRLTFEAVRARCQQYPWQPDEKQTLRFGPANHSIGTEEFRTLRSRLYQIREKRPLRTLLVTSALPGEGKTFVAANLAHVIVRQHERRALLVDADLRWSRLHNSLGARPAPGLSEFLQGQADEFSILQRGALDNLFFIPGGKPASNPAELIANGRLKPLLERLAPAFDWIILDSPPIVPVSDASLLADMCDGTVMVVQAAATPFDLAQKACQEFREKHVVGVVLNRVEPGFGYNSYYYERYRGYGKHGKEEG
jgi:capsular exopolysaccharide synthesis family protein